MSTISFLPFDDWLRFIFDHEATGPEWYGSSDAPYWNAQSDVTAQYLIKLFSDPSVLLASYSNGQINKGLWYMISPGLGEHMLCLDDPALSLSTRKAVVRSCLPLFEKLFRVHCSQHLSHKDWHEAAPLNSICYMWWDITPVYGGPDALDQKTLQREAVNVMFEVLALESIACQESALHGLGHWCAYDPDGITAVIDDFLGRAERSIDLQNYALSARSGCVL